MTADTSETLEHSELDFGLEAATTRLKQRAEQRKGSFRKMCQVRMPESLTVMAGPVKKPASKK
ncbi:hypothetical protein DU002_06830 [Corallincola holothuriorum]|uniref:Uncharacterized protein n=1 Tax=Corallincola holothuriorum TaxID=2282215 RepID=A0A368NNJ5_9GAMM|nr:hypothetical protein DU002_06830 [Corallincola holothuriorum]